MTPTPYDDLIREVATFYALPLDLLTSQVIHESAAQADAFRWEHAYYDRYIRHNPKALGFKYGPLAACSFGLMQIVLETALELGFADDPWALFVPRVGLNWGAKKMQQLWANAGNTSDSYRLALVHYNGTGPAAERYADLIYVAAGRTV